MTDAPERIWAWESNYGTANWSRMKLSIDCTEYIRADLSSPLGAVAMREACKDKLTSGTTLLRNCGMGDIADLLVDHAADFDTIPMPTHADLLAAALKLPEVAALTQPPRQCQKPV